MTLAISEICPPPINLISESLGRPFPNRNSTVNTPDEKHQQHKQGFNRTKEACASCILHTDHEAKLSPNTTRTNAKKQTRLPNTPCTLLILNSSPRTLSSPIMPRKLTLSHEPLIYLKPASQTHQKNSKTPTPLSPKSMKSYSPTPKPPQKKTGITKPQRPSRTLHPRAPTRTLNPKP